MSKHKYSITAKGNYIKIFIDSILHLQIPYSNKICVQSWKENDNWYKIEFINKVGNSLLVCEYDSREKWENVLKLWNENVK